MTVSDAYWMEDLRGKVGTIADPGEHVRKHVRTWRGQEHWWRTEGVMRVYWVEFADEKAGDVMAAEIDEDSLVRIL